MPFSDHLYLLRVSILVHVRSLVCCLIQYYAVFFLTMWRREVRERCGYFTKQPSFFRLKFKTMICLVTWLTPSQAPESNGAWLVTCFLSLALLVWEGRLSPACWKRWGWMFPGSQAPCMHRLEFPHLPNSVTLPMSYARLQSSHTHAAAESCAHAHGSLHAWPAELPHAHGCGACTHMAIELVWPNARGDGAPARTSIWVRWSLMCNGGRWPSQARWGRRKRGELSPRKKGWWGSKLTAWSWRWTRPSRATQPNKKNVTD